MLVELFRMEMEVTRLDERLGSDLENIPPGIKQTGAELCQARVSF